jgi:hypothetical protein
MSASKHKHKGKHRHPVNEKNLLVATFLNTVIAIVEFAGGILSGSLALFSDALHNLSDAFATFIAYMATLIGRRDANQSKTFGYKRIEILAALINAVILIVVSAFLLKEAWHRWNNPEPINSMIMLLYAPDRGQPVFSGGDHWRGPDYPLPYLLDRSFNYPAYLALHYPIWLSNSQRISKYSDAVGPRSPGP